MSSDAALTSLLGTLFKEADETVRAYLTGIIIDSLSSLKSSTDVFDLIGDHLTNYELVTSEDDAKAKCQRIFAAIKKEPKEEAVAAPSSAKLNMPIRLADQHEVKKKDKKDKDKADPSPSPSPPPSTTTQNSAFSEHSASLRSRDEHSFALWWRTVDAMRRMRVPIHSDCDIHIGDFTLMAADNTELLTNAALRMRRGGKYGLVSRNGCGKSTLLRHLQWYQIDGIPPYVRIECVSQEAMGDERTVLNTVMEADRERIKLIQMENEITEQSNVTSNKPSTNGESKGDKASLWTLQDIYARLNEIGADTAETRARSILVGLGFSEEMLDWPTHRLSGGFLQRVQLASALLIDPDLLLLDEPTNHLDFVTIEWLIQYLTTKFQRTLMVVSHDRYFLNSICTDMIHINMNKKIIQYKGDFEAFQRQQKEKYDQQKRAFDAQQMKRDHIQSYIDTYYTEKKSASQARKIGQVLSKKKVLAKMEMIDDPDQEDCEVSLKFDLKFADPHPLRQPLICNIKDMQFSYTNSNSSSPSPSSPSFLLGADYPFSSKIESSSRIAIVGANGLGKSTLLKLVLGMLNPSNGFVSLNPNAVCGYFSQHHVDSLNINDTPVEAIMKKFPSEFPNSPNGILNARSYLGHFGLTADWATRPVFNLSGGQKSRLVFAIIMRTSPNLIALDEPTNHLDYESCDALIEAIKEYKGAVVCISHDQHFLKETMKEFWAIAKGNVKACQTLAQAKTFAFKGQTPSS